MTSWSEINRSLSLRAGILVWKSDLGGMFLPSTTQYSEELQDLTAGQLHCTVLEAYSKNQSRSFPSWTCWERWCLEEFGCISNILFSSQTRNRSGKTAVSVKYKTLSYRAADTRDSRNGGDSPKPSVLRVAGPWLGSFSGPISNRVQKILRLIINCTGNKQSTEKQILL